MQKKRENETLNKGMPSEDSPRWREKVSGSLQSKTIEMICTFVPKEVMRKYTTRIRINFRTKHALRAMIFLLFSFSFKIDATLAN